DFHRDSQNVVAEERQKLESIPAPLPLVEHHQLPPDVGQDSRLFMAEMWKQQQLEHQQDISRMQAWHQQLADQNKRSLQQLLDDQRSQRRPVPKWPKLGYLSAEA